MSEAAALSLCAAPELRDRALMLILFGAGIRDGEARELRLRDVDLEARTLHVKWKGRKVPADPSPTVSSTRLPSSPSSTASKGKTICGIGRRRTSTPAASCANGRSSLRLPPWWARTLDHGHVAYKKPHTTRHTYATKYLRAGGRLERLSRILGHLSVVVTESCYAHLDLTDLAEDADLVKAVRRREEAS